MFHQIYGSKIGFAFLILPSSDTDISQLQEGGYGPPAAPELLQPKRQYQRLTAASAATGDAGLAVTGKKVSSPETALSKSGN
jgi:hypothetical protein